METQRAKGEWMNHADKIKRMEIDGAHDLVDWHVECVSREVILGAIVLLQEWDEKYGTHHAARIEAVAG